MPAVRADFDHSKEPLEIEGTNVDPMLGWGLTVPFNMLSHHPVISVPSGFSGTGVPTGIQIVGQAQADRQVIEVARAYEAAVGGWFRLPETCPARTSCQMDSPVQ